MTNDLRGKIQVTIGGVTFSGEGTQDWLVEQLDKVLDVFSNQPEASVEHVEPSSDTGWNEGARQGGQNVGSLANYLRTKNATSNQTKRFLATAGWLAKRGNSNLKTSDVSSALKDNHQSRLGNPADALNKNVSKGFCGKTKDGFFITPEGWKDLEDTI